jgi:hypothetical protein
MIMPREVEVHVGKEDCLEQVVVMLFLLDTA